jgi:hypothetical protein
MINDGGELSSFFKRYCNFTTAESPATISLESDVNSGDLGVLGNALKDAGVYAILDMSQTVSMSDIFDRPDYYTWLSADHSNPAAPYIKGLVLPDNFTWVGIGEFIDCEYLTSVVLPQGLTTIGRQGFARCTGLTSITIPASVTSIGDYAFKTPETNSDTGDDRMSKVIFEGNKTVIGDHSFPGSNGLKGAYTGGAAPGDVGVAGTYTYDGHDWHRQ